VGEEDFVPENDLEAALVRAAEHPASRLSFYRQLLDAELYFLTAEPDGDPTPGPTEASPTPEIVVWEGPKGPSIPCFSSRGRAEEAAATSGASGGLLVLHGQQAFETLALRETEAFLNPGLGYGKRFSRREIGRLADGSILADASLTPAPELVAPPQPVTAPMPEPYAAPPPQASGLSDSSPTPAVGVPLKDVRAAIAAASSSSNLRAVSAPTTGPIPAPRTGPVPAPKSGPVPAPTTGPVPAAAAGEPTTAPAPAKKKPWWKLW